MTDTDADAIEVPQQLQVVLPGLVVSETATHLLFDAGEARLCSLRKITPETHPVRGKLAVDERFYEGLLGALDDPLAERLLKQGEPDFATVSQLLPPVAGPGFIGDAGTVERLLIEPEGMSPLPGQLVAVGLLDGTLPAICHVYEVPTAVTERIVFGASGANGELVAWRRERAVPRADELAAKAQYWRGQEPVSAQDFHLALLSLWQTWRQFDRAQPKLRLPEPELLDASRAMLHLGLLTFRGVLPRYGVGTYDEDRHNSFPPAVLFLVQALHAWGHLQEARAILSHYLSRYVKPDGTLDYYGPAVAEYGQLLALIADHVRLTEDSEWLLTRLTLLRPLWQRLVALRAESLGAYGDDDMRYGLIPGLPEADYHQMADEWERFYYSGDVWAARGLLEIGRVLGEQEEQVTREEGARLVAEAKAYREDIARSVARVRQPEYVPPGPGQPEPLMRLTEDRHASYCNYRYFPEMLSAGILVPDAVKQVLDWRRSHGGELLGTTRFEQQLDNWPALHVARGLLEAGEADRYLLLLYAHWAHHCAQGTLASYEQVSIRPNASGLRTVVAGQVLPCQVMVPTMLRWGLVYEERDEPVLWLCRALPRRWLDGREPLRVRGVHTRFGRVGFTIRLQTDGTGRVTLRLPQRCPNLQVRLTLRLPEDRRLHQVLLEGEPLPIKQEAVLLPQGLSGKVRLEVEWVWD